MQTKLPVVLLGLGLGLTGCGPEATQSGSAASTNGALRTFEVRGVVRSVEPAEKSVRIRHEEIPGYMAAMTMPFEVKDTNELAGIGPGDVVVFRMLVTEEEGWIDRVRKVGFDGTELPKVREPVRAVRLVEPLGVGDEVPDYRLTNELGRVVSLSDFRGRALGVTFIFTRCPYPNFCPRQTKQFAAAAAALGAGGSGVTNWNLLTVSFDPDHDTPLVLGAYARQQGYDPARWSFATGAQLDVDAMTEQFGVQVGREGDLFNHNLRTAVVDTRGRVHRILVGDKWQVEDFVAAMREAALVR